MYCHSILAIQSSSTNAKRATLLTINPFAGESEGRRPAPQRGVWGSVPPDPGSAHTKKTRIPQIPLAKPLLCRIVMPIGCSQVFIVCLDALSCRFFIRGFPRIKTPLNRWGTKAGAHRYCLSLVQIVTLAGVGHTG
jgi:hypothetical protein